MEKSIYHIQLFDYNCPSCSSGVTNVFVDDIDEFTEKYSKTEEVKERVDKLMRSKSGEIVTDYYSKDGKLQLCLETNEKCWSIETCLGLPTNKSSERWLIFPEMRAESGVARVK